MPEEMKVTPQARDRRLYRQFESGFASPEQIQVNSERVAASQRLLGGPPSKPGMVRIVHGANENILPVGGQTVGQVRQELGWLFNFASGAEALIEGEPVAEDYVLGHGETLEFISRAGRKGVGRVWTEDEFCDLFRMSKADFDVMVAKGLPVHRLEDGSIRITETDFDHWIEIEGPLLLTIHDLARMLSVSERELWRMRSSGKLPAPIELGPKLIRWGRAEVQDWIVAGCPDRRTWDLVKANARSRGGRSR